MAGSRALRLVDPVVLAVELEGEEMSGATVRSMAVSRAKRSSLGRVVRAASENGEG
jgi:hypothetical protein